MSAINKQFKSLFSTNLFLDKLSDSGHVVVAPRLVNLLRLFRPHLRHADNYIYKTQIHDDDVEDDIDETNAAATLRLGDSIIDDDDADDVYSNSHIEIKLTGRLSLQCGFSPNDNIYDNKLLPHIGNLSLGISSELFVYVNNIFPQMISHSSSQVLKIIKALDKNSSFGETVSREIMNRNYLRLNKQRFQEISVSLRDSTGELVSLAFGTSVLQLHFQKSALE